MDEIAWFCVALMAFVIVVGGLNCWWNRRKM